MDDEASRPAPPPDSAPSDPPAGPMGEAAAWTVLSYLITGPLLYGGLGWLLDRWLGIRFFVAVGIVGGMALGIYLVYVRYGTAGSGTRSPCY